MSNFANLFTPFKIKELEIKNRIVMPPMRTDLASVNDDMVTERLVDYYIERAKGGAGLIIVEHAEILPLVGRAKAWKPLYIGEDKRIPQLKRLVDAVHEYGAKVAIQLLHWGRIFPKEVTGHKTVAPSAIPVSLFLHLDTKVLDVLPKELSIEEIGDLVEKFADGARRAKEAGFDLVELHFGHGYLVHLFFSSYTNKRTDKYGGDVEGKTRFAREILKRVREKVGENYPVSVRISGDELLEGGMTLKETKIIAQILENAGADIIHVSAGAYPSQRDNHLVWATSTPPMAFPRGCFAHLAEGIKKAVSVPVIAAGRINDPELAEKILIEGKADLVSMGRALYADPEMPRKAMEGRLEDIRPCIACNRCIDYLMTFIDPASYVKCSVNAASGKEKECRIKPIVNPKRVLVVGGGPAGMEAARVAALKGHKVFLAEKSNKLGGALNLAVVPPHKGEIANFINYLSRQITKLGVEITLESEVTFELVSRLKPDAIILATGAIPVIPGIPGVECDNVVTSIDVLAGKNEVKGKVVVIGGGLIGCETAEYLAEKNKEVRIVEMLNRIANDVGQNVRPFLMQRLFKKGVKMLTKSRVEEILDNGISINKEGQKQIIEADTIVLAAGMIPDRKLFVELENKGLEVYLAGDCIQAGRILEAVHGGFDLGFKV